MSDRRLCVLNLVYVMLMGALLFSTPSLATSEYSLASQQRPAETMCRAPMHWYVDKIDPRFGLSQRELITATLRATQMWNQAAGVEVFQLSETSQDAIKVSLIYDHRQQLQEYIAETDAKIARLGGQVKDLDAKLAQERTALTNAQEDLTAINARITRKVAQVDEMLEQHANRRGQVARSVAEEINELQSAAQQLVDKHNAQLAEFNQRQASFNHDINMRNHIVEQQNTLASQRNQQVLEREAEWQDLGLGTESGRHTIQVSSSRRGVSVVDERITIYSVSNHLGLVTILAHELGHAIGINHVPGGASIMSARVESPTPGAYPQNLSHDDLEALRAVCGW